MKKFLSCVLAMALVFSLMSMTVFAATKDYPAGGKVTAQGDYDVVGTHGNSGGVNDGVGIFDPTTLGQDVNVNFNVTDDNSNTGANGTPTLVHKYAIDITYAELIFDLTRSKTTVTLNGTEKVVYQVWDVNTHTYIDCVLEDDGKTYTPVDQAITNAKNDANDATTSDEATAGPLTVDNAFMITNHSDLAVDYKALLTNNQKSHIKFNFNANQTVADDFSTVTTTDPEDSDEYITIPAVVSGGAQRDSATYTITANPVVDWNTTINAFQPNAGTSTFVVATMTITVRPTPAP